MRFKFGETKTQIFLRRNFLSQFSLFPFFFLFCFYLFLVLILVYRRRLEKKKKEREKKEKKLKIKYAYRNRIEITDHSFATNVCYVTHKRDRKDRSGMDKKHRRGIRNGESKEFGERNRSFFERILLVSCRN